MVVENFAAITELFLMTCKRSDYIVTVQYVAEKSVTSLNTGKKDLRHLTFLAPNDFLCISPPIALLPLSNVDF